MYGLFRHSLSLAVGLLLASAVFADEAIQLAPEKGVLLLRNGGVLSGMVTKSGDRYYVSLPAGEIRVKVDDVEMACRNLEDGYRRKQSAITSGNAGEHIELARWCLNHELFGHAAGELAEAMATEPRHPEIRILQRRLELAFTKPPERSSHGTVSAAAFSQSDLDTLTYELPAAAVQSFTQSVQPLLLNTCATVGCHGPRSPTRLKLLRIPAGKTASRRLTQRNLHSAVQMIDRDNPHASSLITVPVRPHGKSKTPVFNRRNARQYQKLVDWVRLVCGGETQPEQPPSLARQSEALLQNIPLADDLHNQTEPRSPPGGAGRNNESTLKRAAGADQASPPGRAPVDPFDPEVFNRRFFPPDSDG